LGTSFANGETADAEGNPYAVISDRNIFHLNPPPPPPPVDPPKPSDARKVMLNGFIGKGNSTRALMAIVPKDTKEPTRYLNLAPGERKDDVELVSISLKDEAVDIVNEGTAMLLTIKSNSFASTATAPSAAGAPEKPGRGGFQRPISPAFQRSMPVAPGGGPAAPAQVAAAAQTGGGAVIIGGGNSGSQSVSPYGGSVVSGGSPYGGGASSPYGGSFVTGGSGVSANAMNPGAYNNTGVQVGSLFNSQTGAYQKELPTVAPAPPEVQAVTLAAQAAAGGPPAPPIPGTPGGPPVPR